MATGNAPFKSAWLQRKKRRGLSPLKRYPVFGVTGVTLETTMKSWFFPGNRLAATETKDTAALSGTVTVAGSLAKAETITDTAYFNGVVGSFGQLLALEGWDVFAANNFPERVSQLGAVESIGDSTICYGLVGLTPSELSYIMLLIDGMQDTDGSTVIYDRVSQKQLANRNGFFWGNGSYYLGHWYAQPTYDFPGATVHKTGGIGNLPYLQFSGGVGGKLYTQGNSYKELFGDIGTLEFWFKANPYYVVRDNTQGVIYYQTTVIGTSVPLITIDAFSPGLAGGVKLYIKSANECCIELSLNGAPLYGYVYYRTEPIPSFNISSIWHHLVVTRNAGSLELILDGAALPFTSSGGNYGAYDAASRWLSDWKIFSNNFALNCWNYDNDYALVKITNQYYTGVGIPQYAKLSASEQLTAATTTTTYYLRGYDTTATNFVYWQSTGSPNLSPTITSPPLTGTLTNVCVVGSI